MPNQRYRRGVNCPNCQTLLTTADRIRKSTLQALIFPQSKRYYCDCCGLKFSVMPERKPGKSGKKAKGGSSSYELPPLASTLQPSSTADDGQPAKISAPRQRRTTHLYVTDCPDIPGIRNSADKLAVKRAEDKKGKLHEELQRLRKIERKYETVKKANAYLAKAAAHKN